MIAAPLGEVTTERLELRRLRPDDLDALSQIFADEAVWHYPHRRGLTGEETAAFLDQQIRHWDTLGFGLWLAVERATGRTIGCLGLSVPTFPPEILPAVEVGWRLDPAVWGRGYATEGARAALAQAFTTLGLGQVCSLIQVGNRPSIRVAARLGMALAGEVRPPAESRRGAVRDLMYVLTRPEWAVRARSRRLFAEASGAAAGNDPAIPAAALALGAGRSLRLAWTNALGGMTFELGHGPGRRFVKWSPRTSAIDLSGEASRMEWAASFTPVPRVLQQGSDAAGTWLVTAALPGETAVSERWRADPARAVAAIGRGLRSLHDALPVDACPFSWSAEGRLAGLRLGVRDPREWDEEHRRLPVPRALDLLAQPPSVDRLVVCHGDACAPNTLIDDAGRWSGHVDLGSLGVADRWADLAVATWSSCWNYGPGWEEPLLAAYDIEPDPERTRYYRLLWDLEP